MAYLVGATTVIDDSGNIAWARLTGVPTIGDLTGVTVTNGTPTDRWDYAYTGTSFVGGSAAFALMQNTLASGGGVATNYNCFVESISGGGTSGTVTVTTVRTYVNCACQCRC